jgi:hypothetical protein
MTRRGIVAELNQFAAAMNDLAPASRMDRLHDIIEQTKRDMEAVKMAIITLENWSNEHEGMFAQKPTAKEHVATLRAMLGEESKA